MVSVRNRIREVNLKFNSFDIDGVQVFAQILTKSNRPISFVMDKTFLNVFQNNAKFKVEEACQSIRVRFDPKADLPATAPMLVPVGAIKSPENKKPSEDEDEDVCEEPGWDMLDTEFVLVGTNLQD